jgi:predicted membrane chloride channel (bestrophin family)
MIRFFRRPELFWREIDQIEGSATPYVLKRTLVFGVIALLVTILEVITVRPISIPVTPYEVLGVAMGALLVLRTNAGYERWWEARKLWGGIVNQSRNLVVGALAYDRSLHGRPRSIMSAAGVFEASVGCRSWSPWSGRSRPSESRRSSTCPPRWP